MHKEEIFHMLIVEQIFSGAVFPYLPGLESEKLHL